MAAAGIDFGTLYSKVGLIVTPEVPTQATFLEIVKNELGKAKIPTLVGFKKGRREKSEHCELQLLKNVGHSCRCLKELLGKQIGSVADEGVVWQKEECIKGVKDEISFSFDNLHSLEKPLCISMRHLVGMFLTRISQLISNMKVEAVVVSVPPYYSNRQRCALQDALRIARMECTRLVEDHIATAFLYTFQNRQSLHTCRAVAFCNASESYFSCAIIVADSKGFVVLAERHTENVSGREMIKLLMNHIASQWKEGGDLLRNAKARLKLELACRKCMEILSANKEAELCVDSVMNGEDLESEISRKEFEEVCSGMKQNVVGICRDALSAAKTSKYANRLSQGLQVELVGGCSRIPFVQDAIKEAFSVEEVMRSLNSDESVARGCTLMAADLSSSFEVAPVEVEETCPFGVEVCMGRGPWTTVFDAGIPSNCQVTVPIDVDFIKDYHLEFTARKKESQEELCRCFVEEEDLAKLGSKQWKLAAEISFGNVFSFFVVCGDERFQLRSNVYLEKEELDALIKTEEEFIKKDKEALEVDELRNTLQHYKYDIEKKGWFAAELKCLEEWETENRSPSKADIMEKVNDVLHLRDEVFPGVKALCEEIWRSAYLLASKEKKPLTLTGEEGEKQYEFRKLEVPSCLNLGDSITISEMLCSSCKSIEKKVNVLEAMIDWQKQMSEKLERCKQHIGKYASSPEMKDKIFKELCHPGGDIEENLDCLTRVTRMLSKLEVEIPRYVNSEKGKKKITEILISPNKSIESKLSMLEEVETTEKKMMEKLQICKQKIGKYACYPYTERQIIDSLCSDKEDIEESLKKVKPVADVLQKLEVEIPSCLSLRKMIEISGILCSSDKSIEKKVNVLEAMIDWNLLQRYKYDIENKGWFAAELQSLKKWETENRSPSKADIMEKVNDVLHLRDEVFPGVKALCEEIWRSAYLLAGKEKKPLTLTGEEGENQYEFRKLEVPSCLNLGDSITISEMLCSSCKSIEKKVNVLEAMIDWQKQMSEKLERCKQYIGKYASSPEMKDKIFKELCHPGGDIEENLDCLTRVTRMLSKLEVEIPSYVNSEKGKKKITEILISPNKSIESKLSMLEEVETTEKKMMEKLRECENVLEKYVSHEYIVDRFSLDKEHNEEKLHCLKAVAEVLRRLEGRSLSCMTFRGWFQTISDILDSSDSLQYLNYFEYMLNVLLSHRQQKWVDSVLCSTTKNTEEKWNELASVCQLICQRTDDTLLRGSSN